VQYTRGPPIVPVRSKGVTTWTHSLDIACNTLTYVFARLGLPPLPRTNGPVCHVRRRLGGIGHFHGGLPWYVYVPVGTALVSEKPFGNFPPATARSREPSPACAPCARQRTLSWTRSRDETERRSRIPPGPGRGAGDVRLQAAREDIPLRPSLISRRAFRSATDITCAVDAASMTNVAR
jgi:hypothetical protein